MNAPAAITPAQCRAARAILDWSQEKLAESAHVGRATIADFERGTRIDVMRQNMISIINTLVAAGVEFVPEADGVGAGVRSRKVELLYSKDGRRLAVEGGLLFQLQFRGERYQLHVTREVLDDLGHLAAGDDKDRERVAAERLGTIMVAAETKLVAGDAEPGGRITLTHRDFPPGTF